MSETTGMVCTIRYCGRCFRDLAPTSGGDCPRHTLPCCGGEGLGHKHGCTHDPAYIAGRKWAEEREKQLAESILGKMADGTAP